MKHSLLMCLILASMLLAPALAQDATEIRHTHYALNVRSGGGLGNPVIGSVNSCDRLEVVAFENRWYEIKFGDGTGFVAGWYTAAGEPHCGTPSSGAATTSATTTTTTTTTTSEAPASGESGGGTTLDNFQGNTCYSTMNCGDGISPQSIFLWKTGWCAATISAGVADWTLQQCQIGLGLIPGVPAPALGGSSGGSAASGGGGGTGGGGGGGPASQSPGQTCYGDPYNVCCPAGQSPILPQWGGGCGD